MEHLTYVLILTITTSLGAVSTQKEYANTYSNCVEHGMAWADTQRPLHPDDTVSWDCKLADVEPHPDSPQNESAPPPDTTPVQTLVPIPKPKPH